MHSLLKKNVGRASRARAGKIASLTLMAAIAWNAAPAARADAPPAPATASLAPAAHPPHQGPPVTRPDASRPEPARPAVKQGMVVVLGDSLSAGYGLPPDTGWVHLLQQRLAQTAPHYSVSNASISGDTTSGGLSRLPAVLARLHPAIVIVELGGNDALRGLPLATTRQNLASIITQSQAAGARVVLVGMQIPPNYGQAYTTAFTALYADLADHYHVTLVPFLLKGIADKPELFQADQIHPLPQAQPVLLDNVWKRLQALIQAKPPGGR